MVTIDEDLVKGMVSIDLETFVSLPKIAQSQSGEHVKLTLRGRGENVDKDDRKPNNDKWNHSTMQ